MSWALYAAAWLALGVLADLFCEWHAKKERRRYERSTQMGCYVAGPIIIPLALLAALYKVTLGKK